MRPERCHLRDFMETSHESFFLSSTFLKSTGLKSKTYIETISIFLSTNSGWTDHNPTLNDI